MRSAGFIISINKDRNAAIAGFSDLVVVGDIHRVVPKLTELVEAHVDGAASG